MTPDARKRLLFVDDEPMILQGLRDLLRSRRREWDMHFACSAREALALLETVPIDVVVSDMRMPEMDGATLLRHVRDRSPRTVRIVLSGHAEMEFAVRTVPVAHQFLSKPCDPAQLAGVIGRACTLQALLGEEALQRRIGAVSTLPSLPRTWQKLTDAMMEPTSSIKDVARLVEADLALSARVLQVVNSAFFALPRALTQVDEAVSYVGLNLVRSLTLSEELTRMIRWGDVAPGFDPERLQRHSLATASIARRLVTDKRDANDAFTAGLLHDLGELVRASREPELWARIDEQARAEGLPDWVIERRELGFTHAEEGAYLLGLWGLPYPIVEAAAFHHDPSRLRRDAFGVPEAVHVASALANALLEPESRDAAPDARWVAEAGHADRLAVWTATAHQVLSTQEAA